MKCRARFQLASKFNRFSLSWSQGATALRVRASYCPAAIMMDNEKLLLCHLYPPPFGTMRFTGGVRFLRYTTKSSGSRFARQVSFLRKIKETSCQDNPSKAWAQWSGKSGARKSCEKQRKRSE